MKLPVKLEITISNRTILRIILTILGSYLAFRFLLNVSHVLELLFTAFFLALALNPAVSWIARKLGLKRRVTATGIAYLVVVAIISALIALVAPSLIRQTVGFISTAPETIQSLKEDDSFAGSIVQRYELQDEVDGLSEDIQARTRNFKDPLFSNAGKVGNALLSIITVLVLTFMMLVEGPVWVERIFQLQRDKDKQLHARDLVMQMYSVVTGYVNGQLLLALIGASINFVVLVVASTLLDVSINAVALAGILVFTGLIPMIGQTIGAVIVVISALFVSLPLALIMAVFMLIYQQIENVTLQPYIQAKYNELTPLLVFVAALLGVGLGGLLGAFVAIPAAGCIRILFNDYLSRRKAIKA